MLTDLTWLEPGKPFPPEPEKKRIQTYRENERLFLSEHVEVYKVAFDELKKKLKQKQKDYPVTEILNYQQLLSKKVSDFVCGEAPEVQYSKNSTVAKSIDYILETNSFWSKLYEGIIDVTRYGNGVAKIMGDRLSMVDAGSWYPIVNPYELKHIEQQVVAYPVAPDKEGKYAQLYAEIHKQGNIERRWYEYKDDKEEGKIGKQIKAPDGQRDAEPVNIQTFFMLTNVTHSRSVYGLDDYLIINSIVQAIMWRLYCANRIMDKHSEPSLSGPTSALTWDERTKTYYLDLASYFKRENADSPDVKYLTWDGNLDNNFKQIEILLEQLYILSEMGAAFVVGGDAGATSSGTALKLRLVSPRIKAQRIATLNTAMVKAMIVALCAANGLAVDSKNLGLFWNDGLPDDPVEDANRHSTETAGKQTKSVRTAITERGLTEEQATEEYERILEEQNSSMPVVLTVPPTLEEDEDDELGTED